MAFPSLLLAFALLRLVTAVPARAPSSDVLDPRSHCLEGIHIIATRGDSTKDPPYGGLTTTIGNYTAAIADSNAIPNKYSDDSPFPPQVVAEGTESLKKKIKTYVSDCPNTKIVLLGYSEGAVMTMNAICGYTSPGMEPVPAIHDSYASNIIAVVVYGDESRKAGQSYNRGTCIGSGIHARKEPQCGAFHPVIRSYCDDTDPYCCLGGTKFRSHYAYPGKYDLASTKYVTSKYDGA